MVGNVNNGGGYACVGPRGIWQISVHSAQFCCKPKIALKDKVCFLKLLYSGKKNESKYFCKFRCSLIGFLLILLCLMPWVLLIDTHEVWRNPLVGILFLFLRSDVAILYNDRSVLENHHVSAAYRLMQEEEMNVLINLSKDDWRWVSEEI